MIGLVIVCHSAKLAAGVAELAAQVGGGDLRIGVAGGLDQPGDLFGTDATRVAAAIDDVWSDDGVLILMDLGSAVLSAEMAVELLPEERRDRIVLAAAPLVEGAVAAAVAAGLGDSLEEVAAEARSALAAKATHLAPPALSVQVAAGAEPSAQGPPAEAAAVEAAPAFVPSIRIMLRNPLGLHLRPAALLVRTAARFSADVTIRNETIGTGPASARSLNEVAALGARRGDELLVAASGSQAAEALAAIRALADEGFGDAEAADGLSRAVPIAAAVPTAAGSPAGGAAPGDLPAGVPVPLLAAGAVLRGHAVSPGIAVGEAWRLRPAAVDPEAGSSPEGEAGWVALERALAATGRDIRRSRRAVAGRAGEYAAAIFDAQLLFLEDEVLLGPARDAVLRRGVDAAHAWASAVTAAALAWDVVDDPYLRARAADLRSVGEAVLRHLLELSARLDPDAAGIVVVPDLTPAEAARLDPSRVRGLACAFGGPSSHAAILARALGIPAVMGVGHALLGVPEATLLVLDGEAGTVTVAPPVGVIRAAEARRTRRERDEAEAQAGAHCPALTREGLAVPVAANIAGAADAEAAVAAGADAVGLLRTELMFVDADFMPGEAAQEEAYRAVAERLAGRSLTIRTLDVGADKKLPCIPLDEEENPALGVRGIRLGLERPELLRVQLRAVLRVAVDHPVRVLLPMVATVDEVRRARELLEEARASLAGEGIAVPDRIELGIMVEVPAAAIAAAGFAPHVDFFSLGTNDLAQYVFAADRGNAAVAALADPLNPAVLALVAATARAATESGRRVSVCGEIAGDPDAIPVLLGLGVGELSMAPRRIALAKHAVRATAAGAARELAAAALAAGSAAEVRALVAEARAAAS